MIHTSFHWTVKYVILRTCIYYRLLSAKHKLKTLPFSALLRKLDVMTKRKYAKTGRKRGFYALFCYSKFLLFPMSAKIRKNNLDLSSAS